MPVSRRVSEIIFAFGTTGSQWDIRDFFDPSDAHFCLEFSSFCWWQVDKWWVNGWAEAILSLDTWWSHRHFGAQGSTIIAHERLAIVDPDSGDQPLFNEARRVLLLCFHTTFTRGCTVGVSIPQLGLPDLDLVSKPWVWQTYWWLECVWRRFRNVRTAIIFQHRDVLGLQMWRFSQWVLNASLLKKHRPKTLSWASTEKSIIILISRIP